MNEKPRFDEESSAVQAHLSIMQGVIGRACAKSPLPLWEKVRVRGQSTL